VGLLPRRKVRWGGIVEALAPQVGKAALDKLVEQPGIDPTDALFNLNSS
jgi:hypothetical protein